MANYWHHLRHGFVALNTYEVISQPVALNFLKTSFEDLLLPYVTSDTDYLVSFCRKKSIRDQHFKPNTINWDELAAAFPLSTAGIRVQRESNRARWTDPEIAGVAVNLSDDPTRASSLEFGASSEELYGIEAVPRTIQSKMIDAAISTFETISGATGYITVDYVGAIPGGCQSPYETWIGYSSVWASRGYRQRTRGYYWGNFLSEGHVELLGGHEALKKAPVAVVREVGNGYYLQLTEDMNDIDRNKLRQLKEFLKPVLLRTPAGWPVVTEDSHRRMLDFVLCE